MLFLLLKVATVFGFFASPALSHGIVTGIVANGVYTQGWSLGFYYDIVNGESYATTPGWYEDALDSGFIPPSEYQYVLRALIPSLRPEYHLPQRRAERQYLRHGSCGLDSRVPMDEPLGAQHRAHADLCRELQWGLQDCMLRYAASHHLLKRCREAVVGEFKQVDKSTLEFVKIDESGINFTTQEWAAGVMIANNASWTSTVPKSLAPGMYFMIILVHARPHGKNGSTGHYVFRHETIACHGASTLGGAQNYPFCLNIDVTGSGTENPTGTLG
ncbi:Endoglucanase, partial [Lachnellula willkommii]